MLIICLLLLVVICDSCYFYYTTCRSEKPFHDTLIKLAEIRYGKYIIKMESNYEFKKMALKIVHVIVLMT